MKKSGFLFPVIVGVVITSFSLIAVPPVVNWCNSPPTLSETGQKLYTLLDDGNWELCDEHMFKDNTIIHKKGIWITNLDCSEIAIHYKKSKQTSFFSSWDFSYIRRKANNLLTELKLAEDKKAKEKLLQVLDQ